MRKHVIKKLLKSKTKKKSFKTAREKKYATYRVIKAGITADFLWWNVQAKRKWSIFLNYWKKETIIIELGSQENSLSEVKAK